MPHPFVTIATEYGHKSTMYSCLIERFVDSSVVVQDSDLLSAFAEGVLPVNVFMVQSLISPCRLGDTMLKSTLCDENQQDSASLRKARHRSNWETGCLQQCTLRIFTFENPLAIA